MNLPNALVYNIISIFLLLTFGACKKTENKILSNHKDKQLSIDEIHSALNTHLSPLRDLLEKDKCEFPEIEARIKSLKVQIASRYKQPLHMIIAPNYSSMDERVVALARVEATGPVIILFIPTILDIYDDLKASHNSHWEEEFKSLLLISPLHELDHLASGYVQTPTDTDKSIQAKTFREKNTWALTCEYSIRPLITKGLHINESHSARYKEWVKANRNVNSPNWDKFIHSQYESLDNK